MSPASPLPHDVAVAGGGPAGCAAIALARRGRRVALYGRDAFPRFHIGESLLASANGCFEELGIAELVRAQGFPEKWGASLLTHDGAAGRPVDFSSSAEVPRPQTYQVCRGKFDHLLLDRARAAGVEVFERTRVEDCDFGADRRHAAARRRGGPARGSRARALVDATGRAGLVARKLDLRRDAASWKSCAAMTCDDPAKTIDDIICASTGDSPDPSAGAP